MSGKNSDDSPGAQIAGAGIWMKVPCHHVSSLQSPHTIVKVMNPKDPGETVTTLRKENQRLGRLLQTVMMMLWKILIIAVTCSSSRVGSDHIISKWFLLRTTKELDNYCCEAVTITGMEMSGVWSLAIAPSPRSLLPWSPDPGQVADEGMRPPRQH